jgi:hypothetical protein
MRAAAERSRSFLQARALADQGRLSEAVAVLAKAARPRGTRNLKNVQEALVDVGDELKRLDPRKGDYLLQEAGKLGLATNRSVEGIRAQLPSHFRRPEVAAQPCGNEPAVHGQFFPAT